MSTKEEKTKFSDLIERRAIEHGINHIDAINDYCEETNLEVEVAATLLTSSLKLKIEEEAKNLNCLKKKKTKKRK